MRQDLIYGLRAMRNEMEKVAVSAPLKGAGLGIFAGLGDAFRRASGHVDELGRIAAGTSSLDDAAKAAFTAKHKNIAALSDPSTGKLRPLSWENKSEYAKAFLPDAAKTVAGWAGTGAMAGVAAKGIKDYKRTQALKTYAPAAAAGLAGLVGYKALRD